MAAHVDEACRRLPGRWGRGMVREAQRRVVVAQEVEDGRLVPARVPELEGVAPRARQHAEEARQSLPIDGHLRRQLEQHRPGLVAEDIEAFLYQAKAVRRALGEAVPVRDVLRGLPGEHE